MDRIGRFTAVLLVGFTVRIGLDAQPTPPTVSGLALHGTAARTRAIQVTVTDTSGALRDEARPGVAIIQRVAWSPEDPIRDGAAEFELLLATARLLEAHALAGLVTVGNRHGILCPRAESSVRRVVHLGLPVVRLADAGQVASAPDDLLISGGSLTPDDARVLLEECLIRYGALPPAANPDRPTPAEIAAIRARLAMYQRDFDAYTATRDSRNLLVAAR